MGRFLIIASAVWLLGSAPAFALCKQDVPKLHTRIMHETDKDKQKQALYVWNRAAAIAAQPAGSEDECHNEMTRVWHVLNEPVVPKKQPTPADEVAPKPTIFPLSSITAAAAARARAATP
jgi:hypothetical protein